MNIRLIEFAKRVSTVFGLDAVRYGAHVLPAAHLRLCGREFRDDAHFLRSARDEASRLVSHFGLSQDSALLDVGCGFGRLALGVLDQVGPLKNYCGIDVSLAAVAWCKRHIGNIHPSFRFLHLDVRNDRYNPGGQDLTSEFRLPFDAGTFDVAYAYSVFSHMELRDIEQYLAELRRVLGPAGGAFVTLFVSENVPDMTVNPADADATWQGPLHCVRYRRGLIEARFRDAGFSIAQVSIGTETDGQSGYYLRRTAA